MATALVLTPTTTPTTTRQCPPAPALGPIATNLADRFDLAADACPPTAATTAAEAAKAVAAKAAVAKAAGATQLFPSTRDMHRYAAGAGAAGAGGGGAGAAGAGGGAAGAAGAGAAGAGGGAAGGATKPKLQTVHKMLTDMRAAQDRARSPSPATVPTKRRASAMAHHDDQALARQHHLSKVVPSSRQWRSPSPILSLRRWASSPAQLREPAPPRLVQPTRAMSMVRGAAAAAANAAPTASPAAQRMLGAFGAAAAGAYRDLTSTPPASLAVGGGGGAFSPVSVPSTPSNDGANLTPRNTPASAASRAAPARPRHVRTPSTMPSQTQLFERSDSTASTVSSDSIESTTSTATTQSYGRDDDDDELGDANTLPTLLRTDTGGRVAAMRAEAAATNNTNVNIVRPQLRRTVTINELLAAEQAERAACDARDAQMVANMAAVMEAGRVLDEQRARQEAQAHAQYKRALERAQQRACRHTANVTAIGAATAMRARLGLDTDGGSGGGGAAASATDTNNDAADEAATDAARPVPPPITKVVVLALVNPEAGKGNAARAKHYASLYGPNTLVVTCDRNGTAGPHHINATIGTPRGTASIRKQLLQICKDNDVMPSEVEFQFVFDFVWLQDKNYQANMIVGHVAENGIADPKAMEFCNLVGELLNLFPDGVVVYPSVTGLTTLHQLYPCQIVERIFTRDSYKMAGVFRADRLAPEAGAPRFYAPDFSVTGKNVFAAHGPTTPDEHMTKVETVFAISRVGFVE